MQINLSRCWLALLLSLLISPLLHAEEPVRAMAFYEDPLVLHAVTGKQRHLLVVLPQPGISSPVYALKGMVRHEDVEGDAYLQMNNDFGDIGVFFSKGLAASGPMGKISGSSEWRPFILPFYANQGDQAAGETLAPVEVTLALHLPGAGTVAIRDVKLYQYAGDEDPLSSARQGFSMPNPLVRSALNTLIILLIAAALVLLIVRSKGGRPTR